MQLSRRALLGSVALAAAGSKVWAGEVRTIASVQGVGVAKGVVQILYNENPLGPSPLALKAATYALGSSNRYPMMNTIKLVRQLHAMYGLPFAAPDNASSPQALFAALEKSPVLLGVGSTELLRAVSLAYGLEGGEFVEASLGYGQISSAAVEMFGSKVKPVYVPLTPDFRHDAAAMLKAVTPQTKAVVITNPNNPTGTALSYAEIERLADALDPKILLVIDEAYIDYATDPAVKTMVPLAQSRPNVLVTRTFSKIHGLAGLRIGYAIGALPIIQKLRPFTMGMIGHNVASVAAAGAALQDTDHNQRSFSSAIAAKKELMAKLPEFGLTPTASQSSFVWVKVGKDCSELVTKLKKQGVLIAGGQRWNQPNFIRISVGQPAEMEALFTALRT